jgi:hypothetical protein
MTARKVGGHIELDEEEARAGQTGLHVRHIMVLSILLVLTGIGIAALIGFA